MATGQAPSTKATPEEVAAQKAAEEGVVMPMPITEEVLHQFISDLSVGVNPDGQRVFFLRALQPPTKCTTLPYSEAAARQLRDALTAALNDVQIAVPKPEIVVPGR